MRGEARGHRPGLLCQHISFPSAACVIIPSVMTENRQPYKTVKKRVPRIFDDPTLGRIMATFPFPFNLFMGWLNEHITIDNDIMTLRGSIISGREKESFCLKDIVKLLLDKKEVSCFDREGKLDIWGRLGTEMELSLVDNGGKRHVLIKRFLICDALSFSLITSGGQKEWDRFLSELCRYSGLPLEEIS